ncbi:hypothetical protein JOY44_23690 [Phormidium sp. CLA17]|uniref:hypothetical protein n=1 Tax=Leptolyngbya sp. Cla-17 TaxID=2803751 RepID=UPI0014921A54|nr:hypothetical protein [Leptolyngbya sp. Cla-17]MBM0744573.1 hypothetical protein [Leptolyngbya sp. Cla-17]
MSEFRAYPRLEAFERLQISDGLTINAERWQQAHKYHRQRQNFQYQALYEPGIVYGLGVAPIPEQPDGRLLQVQPGVAIDAQGNPIIVKLPEEFRITSEATEGHMLLVYLVVNYVDPDDLRRSPMTTTVSETFRIVEKLYLDPNDVELCRIQLLPETTLIQAPADVYVPSPNQLDFRGRCHPKHYPQFSIQVGQVTGDLTGDNAPLNGLTDLLRSLNGLYPSLRSAPTVQTCAAKTLSRESPLNCQLLYVSYNILLTLTNPGLQRLQTYLAQGNVLLVAIDFAEANLLNLLDIGQELRSGLTEAERDGDTHTVRQLQTEVDANQRTIAQRRFELEQTLTAIAPRLGLTLTGANLVSGDLSYDHPLRSFPFQFSQLPHRSGHPIYVKNWGGLVWMVGDLSQSWGRNAQPTIPREALRSAQEWGINLLHFAAQRYHWLQSMHPLPPAIPIPSPLIDSLQHRIHPNL